MPSPDGPAAPADGGPVLSAEGVVKRYPDAVALDGVDLQVAPGECVALVGESGSGKTTLLRCFNRMVVPDAGTVRVRSEDVARVDPVELRRSVGYVQQEGGLLPHWPVLRNAAFVPWLRRRPDPEARAREALDRVGLPAAEFGARWPHQLSGGQRQRVALARALADRPSVVLLDEPFGALDAITRSEVQESFAAVVRGSGVTALLVTHDLREALLLADRIAVLRGGRVERFGPSEAVRREPGSSYVARLLERAGVGA